MQNEQMPNIEQWAIALQASIDTAKYFLVGAGVLLGGVISLVLYIFRSHKEYTAERFKKSDERCDNCARYNTEEHAKLHGRIDEHIRDHALNENKGGKS